jgi:hypothetical protein
MNSLHTYNSLGHRLHRTSIGNLPGVTTVLGKTKDDSFLIRWKEKVGDEEASRISSEAIDRGNTLHAYIEGYLRNKDEVLKDSKVASNKPHLERMVGIIKPYLDTITPMFIEQATYHEMGFAGSPDCIGIKDGKLMVFDWKNSLKPKKEEYVADYLLQAAAYSLSANYYLGTNITECKVVVAAIKGKKGVVLQEFGVSSLELPLVQNAFKKRLAKYQEMFPA